MEMLYVAVARKYFRHCVAVGLLLFSGYLLQAQAPATPTGLSAVTSSTTAIALSWTDASANETGFQIERSATTGTGFVLINTTAANAVSYTDSGLTPGITYYYRVRAVNGSGASGYSAEASAMTTGSAPAAPSAVTALAQSSSSISLTWRDASGNETGFQVERSLAAASGFALITTTAANAAAYFDTNLSANTTYYYRVRAVNSVGQSDYSSVVSAITAVTAPGSPSSLTVVSVLSTSVSISWTDNSTDESSFEIERSTTSGTGFASVGTVTSNVVSYTDTGLTSNTTYYFRVRASNGSLSAYTAEVSATTLAAEGADQACENIYCNENGGVGIGTPDVPNGYLLAVKGKVIAEGVKVDLQTAWPDYVFGKDYTLQDLGTLKNYIAANGHLPNVPSAETVEREGMDLAQINTVLLEKIEELSLYVIKMEERMRALEKENHKLQSRKKNRR